MGYCNTLLKLTSSRLERQNLDVGEMKKTGVNFDSSHGLAWVSPDTYVFFNVDA